MLVKESRVSTLTLAQDGDLGLYLIGKRETAVCSDMKWMV